jgi:hypothetical protein
MFWEIESTEISKKVEEKHKKFQGLEGYLTGIWVKG